jgi:hypothetical protein
MGSGRRQLENDEANILRKILSQADKKFDLLQKERDEKVQAIMRQYEPRIRDQEIYIRKLREDIGEPSVIRATKGGSKSKNILAPRTEDKLLPVEGTKQFVDLMNLPMIAREALTRLARPSRTKEIWDEIERAGKTFSSTNPYATLKRALVKIPNINMNKENKTWEIINK